MRFSRGRGTKAASFCMNSNPVITKCVVPSRYGLLSLRVTSPFEFTLMRFCTRMYLRGAAMDGQEPALANVGRVQTQLSLSV